ncbi:MAG: oxygenase MpaB family protein [Kineosporiaceae bacterium]
MSQPPGPPDRPDGSGAGSREGKRDRKPDGKLQGQQHEARDADETGRRGPEAGLFGPDSVTWRVHAEPLMGVATLRSLLLMALHPVAMAAFDEYWRHRDLWDRARRITEYTAVTTFGSTTEAMLAASRVRAIHARVRGVLPTGVAYSAQDPQLLAWVHSCLIASFLEVTTRGGLVLAGAEQDRYIEEQVKGAMLVGLEPDHVPHGRASLQDYFRVIKPALECVPAARRMAAELLAVSRPTRFALATGPGPAWAGIAGLAFAALPPWGRRLYALPELPGAAGLTDTATTVGLRTLRASLRGPQAVVPPMREGRHVRTTPGRPEP